MEQPPTDATARNLRFQPIAEEDLALAEYAARLLLSRVQQGLLGPLSSQSVVLEGKSLLGRKTKQGAVLVPARAVLECLGHSGTLKLGVLTALVGGRKVVIPVGARAVLVGAQRVSLPLPVLQEQEEVWVQGKGLAQALGLKGEWRNGEWALAKQ